MHRLLKFSLLLAVVAAQKGYDYNKPGKPFSPNPTNQVSTAAYRNPSTTASYQNSAFGASGYQSGPSALTGSQATGQSYQPSNTAETNSYSAPSIPSSAPAYSQDQTGYGGQTAYQGQQNTAVGYTGQGPSGQKQATAEQYNNKFGQQQNSFGVHSTGDDGSYPGGDYSAIPGEPDRDYPILTEIPQTSFRCDAQAYPGYYADVETRCQVFHVCANNQTFDFLCPNGTIFSQEVFVCVWWNQFDCNSAPSFYSLNANLYDYSKTGVGNTYPSGSNFNQGISESQGLVNSNYQGSYNPQVPTSFGGNTGHSSGSDYSGISSNYDSTGNSPSYQANTSSQGQSPSYPNTQATGSYNGTPSYPDASSQGYPSGKPNGPSFPTGNAGNNAEYQNPPNREYLPPKN